MSQIEWSEYFQLLESSPHSRSVGRKLIILIDSFLLAKNGRMTQGLGVLSLLIW